MKLMARARRSARIVAKAAWALGVRGETALVS
jgi:hypothetical protein